MVLATKGSLSCCSCLIQSSISWWAQSFSAHYRCLYCSACSPDRLPPSSCTNQHDLSSSMTILRVQGLFRVYGQGYRQGYSKSSPERQILPQVLPQVLLWVSLTHHATSLTWLTACKQAASTGFATGCATGFAASFVAGSATGFANRLCHSRGGSTGNWAVS